MFSSETISRNMNNSSSSVFSNDNIAFKHVSTDMMALDFFQNQQNCGGLARFRSAPSSFLATLLDSGNENNSSDEASETIYSNLMNQSGAMKQEIDVSMEQQNGFSNGSYLGMENVSMNCENGNGINHSNLVRQSSPPAGFFNGFGAMGEVGSYRISNHAEANSPTNGLKNHVNFSSGTTSSSRFMPRIPENVNEDIGTSSPENGNEDNSREYGTSLLKESWNDSPFNSLKRNRDGDLTTFSNFNGLMGNENGETRNSATRLTHHLSLPKVPSEMSSVEQFQQFQQDTVPCQIRAKRGCATHPRSIAERMRRTRISEGMKKLQDLCPNMDKQTNTADMLDFAVEYIKELQKQAQTLTDKKADCQCSGMEKDANPTP